MSFNTERIYNIPNMEGTLQLLNVVGMLDHFMGGACMYIPWKFMHHILRSPLIFNNEVILS